VRSVREPSQVTTPADLGSARLRDSSTPKSIFFRAQVAPAAGDIDSVLDRIPGVSARARGGLIHPIPHERPINIDTPSGVQVTRT
jgi:hypothetical protein